MFEKPTSLRSIGLELEGGTIKVAQLSMVKGKPALEKIFETPIQTTPETNRLLINEEEATSLRELLQKNPSVTVLDCHDVLVRPLDLKLRKDKDIEDVLSFQTEPLLPYPIENAFLDRLILNRSSEGTQLNVLAVRKDHVQAHLSTWSSIQIEPEAVTCVPAALALFCNTLVSMTEPLVVLHVNALQTTCVLVKDGKLLAAQSSHLGLLTMQEAAASEPLEAIDFVQLTQEKNPTLFAAWEDWRLDITRIVYALAKQRKEQGIGGIIVTGDGGASQDLGLALSQALNKPLLQPNVDPTFDAKPSQLLRFAVPIGAALSLLPGQDQVNFRQKELAYPYPWRRLKKTLAIYFASCLAVALAFYLFTGSYLSYKEDQLRRNYVALLLTMHKPYTAFEKEFMTKYPSEKDPEEGVRSPKELKKDEIAARLQFLQKDLKDSPDLFPLLPNTPRVSDVVAWLSNHAVITGTEEVGGVSVPKMQLENLNYTMVKRPEPKKPQEKYQAKVELEFSTSTPKVAREFHDALVAPNSLVDPKGEVKWTTNKGRYRASFFLKDKTIYPSTVGGGSE